jgi:hypothetical protein
MALNKDVLGAALLGMAENFNNIEVADLAAAKEAFWKGVAEEVINHIKAAGVVNVAVTTTGTAAAHTGTGVGAMT